MSTLNVSLRTAVIAVFAACGSGAEGGGELPPDSSAQRSSSAPTRDLPAGDLLISAASSLADAFAEIGSAFETAHPNVTVRLNLAGSSRLAVQILEGAPADVFAAAAAASMERVAAGGELSGEARVFARNRLQIIVPRGNPAGVTGLTDFGREALLIGLCAEPVPCGSLARTVLARAGVVPSLDSNEPDARALLTKVELGELDAAISYVTDVAAAHGAVDGVDIPQIDDVLSAYPIAALRGAPNARAARAFIDFVLSPGGQTILARHGFAAP